MTRLLFLVAFMATCVFSGFGQVVTRMVLPGQTDARISTFNTDSHYVYYNASVVHKNKLLVHLPGSYGAPKRSRFFGALAADLGYHSIGLAYPNAPTVASFCNTSADSQCYEKVRREIIEGVDYSTVITIDSIECAFNRLRKILNYLDSIYPSENWGQYLDFAGNVVFNKIIFSGHSQGGGHAALIAKYYNVDRALCFSSPKDYSGYFGKPAFWLSSGIWQTPPNQIFAFNHTLDGYPEQLEILDSLGLGALGAPVNVDSISTPYRNTRQLITNYPVPPGDEHGSTIQDYNTPFVSGVPVFLPVWNYMLTGPVTTGSSSIIKLPTAGILVSPNPASGFIQLYLPSPGFFVKVYTLAGQKVFERHLLEKTYIFNLDGLAPGLYVVNACAEDQLYTATFLRE